MVVMEGQGAFGKPNAGIFGIEPFGLVEGGGRQFRLFAAQLGFGQQDPAAGVTGDQLHGQGR